MIERRWLLRLSCGDDGRITLRVGCVVACLALHSLGLQEAYKYPHCPTAGDTSFAKAFGYATMGNPRLGNSDRGNTNYL